MNGGSDSAAEKDWNALTRFLGLDRLKKFWGEFQVMEVTGNVKGGFIIRVVV